MLFVVFLKQRKMFCRIEASRSLEDYLLCFLSNVFFRRLEACAPWVVISCDDIYNRCI